MDERGPAARSGAIPVIAAVVERNGRYLVARRPPEKRHGNLWEFPGGKVREGEDILAAARRELAEELGLEVEGVGEERFRVRDPGSSFVILFTEVTVVGEPVALEHTAVAWLPPSGLMDLELAPSDARFVREVLLREG